MKNFLKNSQLSLSTLLTSLVSVSVFLTVLILLIASYQSEKSSLTSTYMSLNYSKADKVSRSVDSLFISMRKSLVDITDFLARKELTDSEVQEQFELLRNNSSYFNSIAWVDETGLVRNIAPMSVGLKGVMITEGVSKEILDSKRANVSSPYIAPTGRLIVLVSQPYYDIDGKYKGMIAGTIYLQEKNVLNEILGNDIIEESGSYYYVVGPEGDLLFHPNIKRIGENVQENEVVQRVIHGNSGMKQITNLKGDIMLAGYSYIPEVGWGLVQQTPVSYVEQMLEDHFQKLLLYILPPFLILLLVAILIARKLAAPFKNLAELVNDIASGKQVSVPDFPQHWNREAHLLMKNSKIAIKAVRERNELLVQSATTDQLTKIPNRRKLTEVMESWTDEKQVYSLVVIDIDNFKVVNDTYGHQQGDEVLKFLANTMIETVREDDLCFRYGGEEFVLLLPNTNTTDAFHVAEKLRNKIASTTSPIGKPITVSLGIAEYPFHSSILNELFSMADKALYQSKLEGRNRTTIWSDENV